jgi:acetyl esterase/lipase
VGKWFRSEQITSGVFKGKAMTISFNERKIRASLPMIRLIQRVLPLPVANWLIKLGVARVRLDDNLIREAVTTNGVPCEWIIPKTSPTDIVLLYLHGGGFVYRLTPPHLKIGGYLAQKMGSQTLMVDYRTGPENPFPAALDDCVTAYLWLREQGFSANNIVVAGDSAGGNLTLTMLMKLRDTGQALPAAAACLSPVADLTPKDDQHRKFKDPLISPETAKFYHQSYLGSNDAQNPLISPVFGNLQGLPPLLVHAGEEELLRYDAKRITSLAQSAGVDVRLEIYPRMWHVWQINLSLPQAIQSLDDIADFFKTHLASEL